jgi:hypothetical protein
MRRQLLLYCPQCRAQGLSERQAVVDIFATPLAKLSGALESVNAREQELLLLPHPFHCRPNVATQSVDY